MDTPSIIPLRRCTKCGEEFPATAEYFAKNPGGKYGLRSRCKACISAYHRERRKIPEIAERLNQYNRDLYYRNPEQKAEYQRKKRLEDPDWQQKRREMQKRWRQSPNGREVTRRKNQAYGQSEKGKLKFRAKTARRRAQKNASGGTYTTHDVEIQYRSQKGLCWWCGKPLDNDWHIDHRIPLSRGGSNSARNIVIAHGHCNVTKHNKLPHEFNGRLL